MPQHRFTPTVNPISITIAAGLLVVLGLGCGQSANSDHKPEQPHTTQSDPGRTNGLEGIRVVTLTATDFEYQPAQIQAHPGERIVLRITNQGSAAHSIAFQFEAGDVALDHELEPGASANLTFEAPGTAGTYRFHCPVADHQGRGMEGQLVVLGGE